MNEQDPIISISPFSIEAYDQVYALWQRCAGVGLSDSDSPQNIASYLKRNPSMSFVAHSDKRLVGAILCGHDGRRGYIHHLVVDEDLRRCGIGRRLVKSALSALREEGIQKCHLFIFHKNEPGIMFWQKIGWTFRQDIRVMSTQIIDGKIHDGCTRNNPS